MCIITLTIYFGAEQVRVDYHQHNDYSDDARNDDNSANNNLDFSILILDNKGYDIKIKQKYKFYSLRYTLMLLFYIIRMKRLLTDN